MLVYQSVDLRESWRCLSSNFLATYPAIHILLLRHRACNPGTSSTRATCGSDEISKEIYIRLPGKTRLFTTPGLVLSLAVCLDVMGQNCHRMKDLDGHGSASPRLRARLGNPAPDAMGMLINRLWTHHLWL